jgi:lysyl-tRNA synthetase class 2
VDLFHFVPGYRSVIFDEGKEPLFLLLLGFLVAFAGARGYARLARKRGWASGSVGGVHLHHVVVGIVFLLVAGLVTFTRLGTGAAVRDICAIVFGVGAALVLDEFALVFYLRDVYWSSEGRDSVDAAILGVMIAGLALVVSEPFGLDDSVALHRGRFVFFTVMTVNVFFAAVTFLKAKPFAGFAAIALPPVGWVAAIRLAKPESPWARWFYDRDKLARSEHRLQDGRAARFQRRLLDLVGGQPSAP